jgi:hypothetical protein
MVGVLMPHANPGPAGRGANSDRRRRIALYTAMSLAIPATLGWSLGFVGNLIGPDGRASYVVVAVLAFLFALADLGLVRLRLPTSRTPVPHAWRLRGRTRSAARYGATLSLGFLTPIYGNGFYLILPAILLLGRPWFAAAAYACYGLGRSLPMIAMSLSRREHTGPESFSHLGQHWPKAIGMEAAALVAAGSAAVWAAIQ